MGTALALGAFGFLGGVGITAVGPGGVLPTIGLFALTALSPAQVAGTAIVTHVATGVLGAAAYTRSGQLRDPGTGRIATILAVTALAGTPIGVAVNAMVSARAFGWILAVFVAGSAILVWYREHRHPGVHTDHLSVPVAAVVGFGVAVAAGVVGIGGPMIAVPLLVSLRLPILQALACAQVESVVIAGMGTIGYLSRGAIDWPLAALVGIPELAGVLLGWKIAHALPTRNLERALIVSLLVSAAYLALHG